MGKSLTYREINSQIFRLVVSYNGESRMSIRNPEINTLHEV